MDLPPALRPSGSAGGGAAAASRPQTIPRGYYWDEQRRRLFRLEPGQQPPQRESESGAKRAKPTATATVPPRLTWRRWARSVGLQSSAALPHACSLLQARRQGLVPTQTAFQRLVAISGLVMGRMRKELLPDILLAVDAGSSVHIQPLGTGPDDGRVRRRNGWCGAQSFAFGANDIFTFHTVTPEVTYTFTDFEELQCQAYMVRPQRGTVVLQPTALREANRSHSWPFARSRFINWEQHTWLYMPDLGALTVGTEAGFAFSAVGDANSFCIMHVETRVMVVTSLERVCALAVAHGQCSGRQSVVLVGTDDGRLYKLKIEHDATQPVKRVEGLNRALTRLPKRILSIDMALGESFALVSTAKHGVFLVCLRTGALCRQYRGHVNFGRVDRRIFYHDDLRIFMACGSDGVVRCWDLCSGQRMGRQLPIETDQAPLAFPTNLIELSCALRDHQSASTWHRIVWATPGIQLSNIV